jgi:hypothetical protein
METITMEKCPLCGNKHSYNLDVQRSIVIKMLTPSDLNEPQRAVRMTRIFICPQTDKEYQATLTLYDSSSDRVKSVKVIGIKND